MANKQKSFVDDGWAVWIDGDDISTVYINDWLNPHGRSYVDIAIHTRGIKATHSLNIYIPFLVTEKEVTDVSLLLEDESILYATFNAACIIDFKKNAYTSEIAYHGKTIDLVHISELGYTVKPLAGGTLFQTDLDSLQEFVDNDEVYFLFRIPHKSLNQMFVQKIDVQGCIDKLRDRITTPMIKEKYGYSVRINEARMLPMEINRVGAFHRQKLKRAAISISINEEYEVNDQGCYRIRRLEESFYKNYVPKGFSSEDVITYQWDQSKERNLRGQFNFYFSIARNFVSRTSMLIYMILLVIFGSMGSALCEIIKLLIN